MNTTNLSIYKKNCFPIKNHILFVFLRRKKTKNHSNNFYKYIKS